MHECTIANANYRIAKALADGSIKLAFALLTGTVHEVEHRNGERGCNEIRHKE